MRAKELLTYKRQLILEGGNALTIVQRINREDILPTLQFVVDSLNIPELTFEYVKNNIMGSAGKQKDSGDLDIALDHSIFSKQTLRTINLYVRGKYGDKAANSSGVPGGQLNTAWPISGDTQKGFVQVDFILGDPSWLKFSHHSPGLDVSPYKGVFISTMLGVLAKLRKDYELWPEGSDRTDNLDRVARVGWAYDLEKGLHKKWQLQKRPAQGMSDVSPDEWETRLKVPVPPRISRVGYLTDPNDVVRILLGDPYTPADVDTFEKLWAVIKTLSDKGDLPPANEILDRFAEALARSSSGKDFKNAADVKALPIFNEARSYKRPQYVTRIDSNPISDFLPGLKTYKHTHDWSISGLDDDSEWVNVNRKLHTSKGLFAGDPFLTALYSTGNASETRFVSFILDGKPIVYFDIADVPIFKKRKTYLSYFDARKFRKLLSGEYFSVDPGQPIKQEVITNPFEYIKSQGWTIRFTKDLYKILEKATELNEKGLLTFFGTDGI